jgi:hypothetical protein
VRSGAARPTGRAIFRQAHLDDVSTRRLEELSENVLSDGVRESGNKQLPRIFSHRKPAAPVPKL